MKKIGIYKITSPSGRIYIGQSIDIDRRLRQYRYSIKSCHQVKLKASIEKYGINSHIIEILTLFPKDIEANTLTVYEQFYLDQNRCCGFRMMNIREAGSSGKLSEEARKKISQALKGRPRWNKGVPLSEETKRKISISNIGRKMPHRTEEWKRKQRIAQTGKPGWNTGKKTPDHVREAISRAHKGKKLSRESIIKREATRKLNRKKPFWSEGSRKKMSERMKNNIPWNKKKAA